MDRSKSENQAKHQTAFESLVARIAIVIIALGAVFYVSLKADSDPLAAVNSMDAQAAVSFLHTEPQRSSGEGQYVYVYPATSEHGNVKTYEHD